MNTAAGLRYRQTKGKTDESYQVSCCNGLRVGLLGLRELCRRSNLLRKGESRRQGMLTRLLREGRQRRQGLREVQSQERRQEVVSFQILKAAGPQGQPLF